MVLGSSYQDARQQESTDDSITIWVDGFPYFPFYVVEETDQSILGIVRHLLETKSRSSHMQNNKKITTSLPKDPKVHKVSGGATNRLYRVENYLVRLFGAEGLIDRDLETTFYTHLSNQSLAPKYHGRFANGRIEEYLPNMRTLSTDELPLFAIPIAHAMAKLHVGLNHVLEKSTTAVTPSLWVQLDSWLEQAESLHDGRDDPYRLADIRTEFVLLKREMQRYVCRIGFCHNDILPSNVLVSADSTIQLIDFEYGGVNYCSFDIANHWNEYAGGPPDCTDPDYDKLPDADQQRAFLKAYGGTEELLEEVRFFLRVNHFYWGLWAVVQAETEGCETYNYRRYALNRIARYFATAKESGPT